MPRRVASLPPRPIAVQNKEGNSVLQKALPEALALAVALAVHRVLEDDRWRVPPGLQG
uniref:Uncharacterized protein n=1 Tax=Marseillevirus LCMAC103 TaxID=2506604 RepID=A0A481YUY6_9VIRU|nr:MAG: hypothetical protein LCMAC103_02570 [Marseillevirus LCMAC103]